MKNPTTTPSARKTSVLGVPRSAPPRPVTGSANQVVPSLEGPVDDEAMKNPTTPTASPATKTPTKRAPRKTAAQKSAEAHDATVAAAEATVAEAVKPAPRKRTAKVTPSVEVAPVETGATEALLAELAQVVTRIDAGEIAKKARAELIIALRNEGMSLAKIGEACGGMTGTGIWNVLKRANG